MISKEEATSITNKKLCLTNFTEESPIAHKGGQWKALEIVRNINLKED